MFKRTGPISLTDIKTHFGTNQIGSEIHLDDYYAGGTLVDAGAVRNTTPEQAALDGIPVDAPVPSSGTISFANLYGVIQSKPLPVVVPTNFALTGAGDGTALTVHIGFSMDDNGVITWRIWNPNGAEEQTGTIDLGMGNTELRLSLSGFSNGSGKQELNDAEYPSNIHVHDPLFTDWGTDVPVRFKLGEWFEPRYGMDVAFTVNAFGGENRTLPFTLDVRQANKTSVLQTTTFNMLLDNSTAVDGHFPNYYYMDTVAVNKLPCAILMLFNDPADDSKQYMDWRNVDDPNSAVPGSTYVWDDTKDPNDGFRSHFLGTNTRITVVSTTGNVTFTHNVGNEHKINIKSVDGDAVNNAMRLVFTGASTGPTTHTAQLRIRNDEGDDRTMTLTVVTDNKYHVGSMADLLDITTNKMWVDNSTYSPINTTTHVRGDSTPPELSFLVTKSDAGGGDYDYHLKVKKDNVVVSDTLIGDNLPNDGMFKIDITNGVDATFTGGFDEGLWHDIPLASDGHYVQCIGYGMMSSHIISGNLLIRPKQSVLPSLVVPFTMTATNSYATPLVSFVSTPTDVSYTKSVFGHQTTEVTIERVASGYYWSRKNNGVVGEMYKIGEFDQVGLQCRLTNVVGPLQLNNPTDTWFDVEGDGGLIMGVVSGTHDSIVQASVDVELRQRDVVSGQSATPWGSSVVLTATNSSETVVWGGAPSRQHHIISAIPARCELRFSRGLGSDEIIYQDAERDFETVLSQGGVVELFIALGDDTGDLNTNAAWTANEWVTVEEGETHTVGVDNSVDHPYVYGNARLVIRDKSSGYVHFDEMIYISATLA